MQATTDANSMLLDRPQNRERSALRLMTWGARFAGAAGLIGAMVLVGYATRTAWTVRLSARLPPMYPNAALGLTLGACAAVGAKRRGPVRILAAGGALGIGGIGLISLWLHIIGAERTWFEGLFPSGFVEATTAVGGRPAPETCVAFLLLASALATLILRRTPRLGQALAIAGASVGLSAVVGYLLGVDRAELGVQAVYVGMALHTGLGIMFLGFAIVCLRPNVGLPGHLLNGGIAGGVTRRVTLAVVITPALLLLLGVALARVMPEEQLAQSIFSVLQVGVLSGAVLIPSAVMSRTEQQLRKELDATRRRNEHESDLDTLVEAITAEMIITSPDLPGWDFGVRYQPATGHLAGDSVQVHIRQQPTEATLIALVDVAGHDVYSAVVAYGLRSHIGALWEIGADLSTIVASVNAKLLRRRTIATAIFLVVDPLSESIEFVNAGHPAPLHLRHGNTSEWTLTGPLLGLPNAFHDVRVIDIQPDDLVVLFTDGVTEARSPDGRQLGKAFIHRVITARQADSPRSIADACVDAAIEHARSRLSDDVLVIAARRAS